MTVCGKPGKRWCCFPPFPQTLEIDEADSHIPTAATTTRMNLVSSKTGELRDTYSEGKVNPPLPARRATRQTATKPKASSQGFGGLSSDLHMRTRDNRELH